MEQNKRHTFEGITPNTVKHSGPFRYAVYKEDGGRTIRIVKERLEIEPLLSKRAYPAKDNRGNVAGTAPLESGRRGGLRARHVLTAITGTMAMLILVPLLSAFEAHVINVTATIEQNFCDARSIGYWKNHEGCSKGEGESEWTEEINEFSSIFSGVFSDITGTQICAAVWIPNCTGLDLFDKKLCQARAHTLADELNIVSNRLALNAFLAGADDGSPAFDRLHLNPFSTIQEAIITIEAILHNEGATLLQIVDALHVAERIYTFYEEENPFAPNCVFDPDDVPLRLKPFNGAIIIENHSTSTVQNNGTSTANTGGNSSGDGTAHTGSATSTAEIINILGTSSTTVDVCCNNSTATSTSASTSTPTTLGDEVGTSTPEVLGDDTYILEDSEATSTEATTVVDTTTQTETEEDLGVPLLPEQEEKPPEEPVEVVESSENVTPDPEVTDEPEGTEEPASDTSEHETAPES